jgi:CheY-like chemotaxis protein
MPGFEVLERLKAEASTKNIPVVICMSRVLTSTERNQRTGKAVAVLNKGRLDHGAVAQELQRIINGVELAATLERGQTA